MAFGRMSMRKAREILRLKWGLELSNRDAARSCRVSPATVTDCLSRAKAAGLSWPLPENVGDEALEANLYPHDATPKSRALPDFQRVFREMAKRGVTLQLLWQEYKLDHPDDGYQYSQFTVLYQEWAKQLDVVMHQHHRAGEKLFVDYAGQTIAVINPNTGKVSEQPVFVAALGASSYTFARACEGQDLRSFIDAHVHTYAYIGGVTEVTVPDNLKAGVTKPCFYDPEINPTYQEMAEHYGTVIIPARVRKPRDKAKVENAVQQVERWVLAPLRNQQFFSVAEANRAILERLDWLNNRPFQKLDGSRRSLFEELDKPALKPLPTTPYEMAEWKTNVAVNIDYHVEFDAHYYSVPYVLVGKRVDIRATRRIVECFCKGRRIASHVRGAKRHGYSTNDEHRPKSHQRYAQWPPSRLVHWGASIGPATGAVITQVLASKPHPEQGYRSALGVLRLGKVYGKERLEKACARAQAIGSSSYQSIKSILKTGFDLQPPELAPQTKPEQLILTHENIRGPNYYH